MHSEKKCTFHHLLLVKDSEADTHTNVSVFIVPSFLLMVSRHIASWDACAVGPIEGTSLRYTDSSPAPASIIDLLSGATN